MRAATVLLVLLMAASPVQANRDCDLEKLKDEIRWCLVDAPEGTPGRERMLQALNREGALSDIFEFRVGFAACYDRDRERLQNLLECRRDHPSALINFGRELIGLPPALNGS